MKTGIVLSIAALSAGMLFAQPEPPDPPGPPRREADERVLRLARPRTAYLGIGVADIDAERAKALKLPEERGVEVKSVTPDGPAAKAGIREGDVVLEYNGQRVESQESLLRMVRETPPGRQAKLAIWRNGASQTVTATLGTQPRSFGRMYGREWNIEIPDIPEFVIPRIPDVPRSMLSWRSTVLGVESESLGSQLAEFFGVKEGVLVRSVVRGSPAEKAGIKAGDVITKVDGTKVTSPREISGVLRDLRGTKRTVPVTVVRERKEMTLDVLLEEQSPEAPRPVRAIVLRKAYC